MNRTLVGLIALAALLMPLLPSDSYGATGKENYATYCMQCHGINGTGKGINVRDMAVQPRDHTDAKAMNGLSNDRLFKAIKEGGPAVTKSVLMPAWKSIFTDEEIRDLVAHLRVLCACTGPQ